MGELNSTGLKQRWSSPVETSVGLDGEVPIEPEPSRIRFPRPAEDADDLVGHGADLSPGTLLAAYRAGYFPMPRRRGATQIDWWSPQLRGVLPLGALRVSRSLRRSTRRFEVRVDSAFAAVVDGCADPSRPSGWIDDSIRAAYLELHRLGWAHSVEAWQGEELVGGLYGVGIGGLFAGESMYSATRDASKVALVGLVELLNDEYAVQRILDAQWLTPHLASLGFIEMRRTDYLARLPAVLELPLPAAFRSPGAGPNR